MIVVLYTSDIMMSSPPCSIFSSARFKVTLLIRPSGSTDAAPMNEIEWMNQSINFIMYCSDCSRPKIPNRLPTKLRRVGYWDRPQSMQRSQHVRTQMTKRGGRTSVPSSKNNLNTSRGMNHASRKRMINGMVLTNPEHAWHNYIQPWSIAIQRCNHQNYKSIYKQ